MRGTDPAMRSLRNLAKQKRMLADQAQRVEQDERRLVRQLAQVLARLGYRLLVAPAVGPKRLRAVGSKRCGVRSALALCSPSSWRATSVPCIGAGGAQQARAGASVGHSGVLGGPEVAAHDPVREACESWLIQAQAGPSHASLRRWRH